VDLSFSEDTEDDDKVLLYACVGSLYLEFVEFFNVGRFFCFISRPVEGTTQMRHLCC